MNTKHDIVADCCYGFMAEAEAERERKDALFFKVSNPNQKKTVVAGGSMLFMKSSFQVSRSCFRMLMLFLMNFFFFKVSKMFLEFLKISERIYKETFS